VLYFVPFCLDPFGLTNPYWWNDDELTLYPLNPPDISNLPFDPTVPVDVLPISVLLDRDLPHTDLTPIDTFTTLLLGVELVAPGLRALRCAKVKPATPRPTARPPTARPTAPTVDGPIIIEIDFPAELLEPRPPIIPRPYPGWVRPPVAPEPPPWPWWLVPPGTGGG
jgi:hypothetical protein